MTSFKRCPWISIEAPPKRSVFFSQSFTHSIRLHLQPLVTLPYGRANYSNRIQSDSLNPKRFALWLLWPGEQAMNPLEFRQLCQTFLLAQPLPYPWFRVSASYDHHYRLTT